MTAPAHDSFDDLINEVVPGRRDGRRRLITRLVDEGVATSDIRDAAASGSLAALLAGNRISGPPKYTAEELAEQSGLDLDFLLKVRRASGLPVRDTDEAGYYERDLAVMRDVSQFLDAGFAPDRLLEVIRVLGRGLRETAEAMRHISTDLLADLTYDEDELAVHWATIADGLLPVTVPSVERVLMLHLREVFSREVLAPEEDDLTSPDTKPIAVAFADLVGFTRLGEELPAYELGRLADRLVQLSEFVVSPDVRFVKTIGDAVMLVSPDVDALLDATLTLVEMADAEGDDFPQLRAGIGYGNALNRHGDWFGRAVNRASHITSMARPGSVLLTEAAHTAAGSGWEFSALPPRRVKGVTDHLHLYRARTGKRAGPTT